MMSASMKHDYDPDAEAPRASRHVVLGFVGVPLSSLVLGACGVGDAPPSVGSGPAPSPAPSPTPSPSPSPPSPSPTPSPSPSPSPPPPGGIDALTLNFEPATPE